MTFNMNYILEKGEIIHFTSGEYSDFSLCGSVIMPETVDLVEFVRQFFVGLQKYGEGENSAIASVLVAKEKALPLAERQVHIGSYGDFPDEFGLDHDENYNIILKDDT